jgi:hypothetical protein
MILTKLGTNNGQFSETGNIAYTRRIKWKQKHITICVGHHYAQAKTDNGNKTHTTGGNTNLTSCLFGHRNGHQDTELTKG